MSGLINFESNWEKASKREETRKAREHILQKAKQNYDREQKKQEEAKLRGEDTWMLGSVNNRITKEEQITDKAKKNKKSKKKKNRKEKKKKKKKKDTSSSDSDSDSEPQWVEKKIDPAQNVVKGPIGPKLQRDNWMMAPFEADNLPTISRAELRAKKEKEEEERRAQEELINQPGQHERELNPYWKSGGTGLPEDDPSKSKETGSSSFAPSWGGVSWLKKALHRCEEQAQEEGRSLEDIAAERYGSLKKLKEMIKDAEEKASISSRERDKQKNTARDNRDSNSSERPRKYFSRPRSRSRSPRRHQRSRSNEREYNKKHSSNKRDKSDSSDSDSDNVAKRKYQDKSRDYYSKSDSKSRDRNRSRSRDRKYENKKDRHAEERQKVSSSRYKDSYHSRDRYSNSKEGSSSSNLSKLSGKFKRPKYDSDSDDEKPDLSPPSRFKNPDSDSRTDKHITPGRVNKFKKPGSDSDSDSDKRDKYKPSRSRPEQKSQPSWKKKEFLKPVNEEETRVPARKEVKTSVQSSSSTSDSSSSSEEEEDQPCPPQTVKILSEQEMNQLGAKILKAEIMGNQTLADDLKAQLAAAQAAKKAAPVQKPLVNKADDNEEEKVIVLTKTNKKGMVRPLGEREHPVEPKQGRRKKQKVETHTGDKGERTRYFHDDDKYDLKTLVEQERMGSAEDSNMMFARLAGRSVEKTDDDYQVDDMFISRASKKVSDSKTEDRDRYSAIMEHKKMAKGLDKCQFCFDKVPKHLIIAIGVKCYLCLPNHTSLTEGHCQIVPMQHVKQGTVVDEDVWDEIQVFRKGLTKMFEERDEDCVFMEMSRNLNYHPHMFIDCIPMDKEVGDMAPIYFKKAIMESESEWAQNKKVVDISKKDIRHSVPKGFPYFSVDFGLQGGFAHVIEDEKEFPAYFGREVVGGMLDVGPNHWRKPQKESFEDQRKKVLKFAEIWKPYDWTQSIGGSKDKSDES